MNKTAAVGAVLLIVILELLVYPGVYAVWREGAGQRIT